MEYPTIINGFPGFLYKIWGFLIAMLHYRLPKAPIAPTRYEGRGKSTNSLVLVSRDPSGDIGGVTSAWRCRPCYHGQCKMQQRFWHGFHGSLRMMQALKGPCVSCMLHLLGHSLNHFFHIKRFICFLLAPFSQIWLFTLSSTWRSWEHRY